MTRRRYIPMKERAAAFASMLLDEKTRTELRRRKATSDEVLRLSEIHHIIKWSDVDGISDEEVNLWPNLHVCTPTEHKEIESSLNDRKYKRSIKRDNRELSYGTAKVRPRRRWPSGTIPSRPFPKKTP